MRCTLLTLLCFAASGCQTITIINDQGKALQAGTTDEQWNHTGIFGLVGYSGKFSLNEMCPSSKKWKRITTEVGVGPSLANLALQGVTFVAGPVGIAASVANFAWDPLTLRWTCAR